MPCNHEDTVAEKGQDRTEMARVPQAVRKAMEELMSYKKWKWCVFCSYYCIIDRFMHDSSL